ncbi:MAG: LamG-like jellyroll fold domain-containing protein, partial [Rectinemataceae bacterium]|nr:LamG-like jellyroll fold domain-containing protein [Rectinemataceae bacterium]
YFLLQNWKGAHAPVNFKFTANEWTHMIASWRIGEKPFLRVFANGKLILGNDQPEYLPQKSEPVDGIFIGSDPDGLRSADGLIDEVVILDASLTGHDAMLFFHDQGGKEGGGK